MNHIIWTLLSLPISYSQFLQSCQSQLDCLSGSYCEDVHFCSDCSYIDSSYCNSINGCCSPSFLQQCPSNPYQCSIQPTKQFSIVGTPSYNLHKFLLIFVIVSSSYLSSGMYYNKYMKQKEGIYIIPNMNTWNSLCGLVRDGMYYSIDIIHRRFCRSDYDPLE